MCAQMLSKRQRKREGEGEKEDRQFDRGSAGYHVNRQRRHLVKITQKKPKAISDL